MARTRKDDEGHIDLPEVGDVFPDPEPPHDLDFGFQGLHAHLDKIDAQVEALREEVRGPVYIAEDNPERPKVNRRRSLDAMQFALKRLASGGPLPADDDSAQIVQDKINEAIALRQIMNEMMQASSKVYQNGLVAIRNITNQ